MPYSASLAFCVAAGAGDTDAVQCLPKTEMLNLRSECVFALILSSVLTGPNLLILHAGRTG